ncbi:MAG: hypothetical protein EBZ50_00275 [Alphaproteobacteria bacterium]|nr:hypothetical protein [Alphaproteobacteria bacterium]
MAAGGHRLSRRIFGAAVLIAALVWCIQFIVRASPGSISLPMAPMSPLAAFEGDAAVANRVEWTNRRVPHLRRAFLADIYGELPTTSVLAVSSQTIDEDAIGGTAQLDRVTIELRGGSAPVPLELALMTPRRNGPSPLIILSDFCGLDADIDARLPAPSWRPERCRTELGRMLTRLSHGDAILRPPVATMIARGYAVAIFFAGDVAPDDPALFREAPIVRGAGSADSGAIAVWASLYLRAFDALRGDPRVSKAHIAFWGHSRYGKAALLAAALDERVGAVVANQSGTFGATLSSATRGESPSQILKSFPHWFPTRTRQLADARERSGLDQQMLLAMIAPRPVLLGNAGLDKWSDPAVAFAAARAASTAYGLFGSQGLAQASMRDPDLGADLAFYIRPGGHGVRTSDWIRTLDFLDRHFVVSKRPSETGPAKDRALTLR